MAHTEPALHPPDTSTPTHGVGQARPAAEALPPAAHEASVLDTPPARLQASPVRTPERSARPPDLFTEARAALGLETLPISRYFQSVGLFAPPGRLHSAAITLLTALGGG